MKKPLLTCAVHRRDFPMDSAVVCQQCYKATFDKCEELEATIQSKNERIEFLEGRVAKLRGKAMEPISDVKAKERK